MSLLSSAPHHHLASLGQPPDVQTPSGPGAGVLAGAAPVVAMAVGKPPRPGTLVAEVAGLLRAAGVRVEVVLPHQDPDLLEQARRTGVGGADLLVHRGLRPGALAAVVALQTSGVPCCNDASATATAGDRTRVMARLLAAGVPVPASWRTDRWSEVRAALSLGPHVVKRADDAGGRAAGVALLPGQSTEPPFEGPWLVQVPVDGDGVDRKLYVTGDRVAGLLKPGPLLGGTGVVRGFEPDVGLRTLARRVGAELGLHLYGVDVIVGTDGPVVVDVNPLPGYRGVTGAPREVADHLLRVHLGRGARSGSPAPKGPIRVDG